MAAIETNLPPSSASALPGLGRALVMAGKLDQRFAEEIYRKALAKRSSFIAELTGSGALTAADLAHTLSLAFAVPLIDLDAVDVQQLPRGLLDNKICQDYRLVVLGKRQNRLIVATADPSDQQSVEKIKFSTQQNVDWVIAEYDKLLKMVSAISATVAESINSIVGNDFEFDDMATDSVSESANASAAEVDDAPVVKFLQKMLVDAFTMRASDQIGRASCRERV